MCCMIYYMSSNRRRAASSWSRRPSPTPPLTPASTPSHHTAFSYPFRRPSPIRTLLTIGVASALLVTSACGSIPGNTPNSSSDSTGSSGPNSTDASGPPPQPTRLNVVVKGSHPWDKTSFTQGLEVGKDGNLVVGTGQYRQSRIYRTTVDGKQSESQNLPDEFFGEGITITGDTVWQLTWKEHTAIKRNAQDLRETGRVRYDGEGWGLCAQQDRLVMSDGSGTLTFRDPSTFDKTGEISVTKGGQATTMLNELECTPDGSVWANVWQTNQIYLIDPATGFVTGIADLTGKLPAADRRGADVLNGIAFIPQGESTGDRASRQRFYLTGKWWDTLYEVTFS
ncbi:Glutamine cyclotransferase [Corynebacterium auriscanis]|nr:Glutamine cyclotransferase [Corynebacterium auriscanis]